ncbi:MAG: phage tail protein [Selenomonadaceae bacterium]|nr:phage tail protein [Selenomonadaceae bacterium]
MTIYKTVLGDTWDIIAKKQMGGERYASKLISANQNYVSTIIFSAGISLNIPDIDPEIPSILPPWKR